MKIRRSHRRSWHWRGGAAASVPRKNVGLPEGARQRRPPGGQFRLVQPCRLGMGPQPSLANMALLIDLQVDGG